MPDPTDGVTVQGVEKRFGDVRALRGITFSAPRGSVLGILGPNGAGKTTVVNVLTTLLRPDAGTATVAGFDVVRQAAQVRRAIMVTGQYAALDESLSGRENLVLFGRLMGLDKRSARVRTAELLADFDLVEAAGRKVGGYSGGMRRRIDIACGLVVRPDVVFLDEPTTGLDPRSRQFVWDLVSRLKDDGITTVLTTQYLDEVDVLSDNIVVIDKGTVVAEGTADQLKERTGTSYCEIVPLHTTDLPQLLAALGPLVPAGTAAVPAGDRVSIPAPQGATTLAEALRRLDAAQVEIADIALRRPSLDDVFFALTAPTDAETDQDSAATDTPAAPRARPAGSSPAGSSPAGSSPAGSSTGNLGDGDPGDAQVSDRAAGGGEVSAEVGAGASPPSGRRDGGGPA